MFLRQVACLFAWASNFTLAVGSRRFLNPLVSHFDHSQATAKPDSDTAMLQGSIGSSTMRPRKHDARDGAESLLDGQTSPSAPETHFIQVGERGNNEAKVGTRQLCCEDGAGTP